MIVKALNSFTKQGEVLYLDPVRALVFRLRGRVPIGQRAYPRWSGTLEFWLVRCKDCGTAYTDYPHSWDGFTQCPNCKGKS
ncbi:MAG: hypothetical protein KGI38_12240 [Thaumarchaeota archaeon]|nr:hypothetical protein [Nitrososphaerota archaeon]